MSKKNRESEKGKAIRALRLAFKFAEQGDRDKSITMWEEAAFYGYAPKDKTIRCLEIVLNRTCPLPTKKHPAPPKQGGTG